MNKDVIQGKWSQVKGEVQKTWGKLTDDDLDKIEGNREKLLGKIQETYGRTRDAAEKELKDWEKTHAA